MDPRSRRQIAAVIEAVAHAGRQERVEYGPVPPDPNESARRSGLTLAGRWLLDRETVGPLSDGPPSSAERVQREYELARQLLPDRLDPFGRYCRSPGRGFPQRMEYEVLGIAQLLGYALGVLDTIPVYAETEEVRRAA